MKIAMLGHKRIPSREGGVEIVVEELASRMVQKGHDVTVYNRKGHHIAGKDRDTAGQKRKAEYQGIHIVNVPTVEKKSLNAIVYSFFATWKAVRGKYDVIHFHAEGPCLMLPIAKRFSKAICIATIHGLDWQRSKWGGFATKMLLHGERMAARYADEIIVLSKNVQNYFKEQYGRECRYIPNGVNLAEKLKPEIITKEYGLKGNDYILFLARIVPEKGLHYLIEAYKELQTDKKLVIAGSGSHTDQYVEQIKEMTAENPDIIMTGFVEGKKLQELYSNAYVYVLPSDVEGMPLSLLEAMSYGNCCLVSDIPENAEVVQDKADTFSHSDVEDLKVHLERLLYEPERVVSMQKSASEYICNKYNWDDITDRTLEIYESINRK